MSSRPEQPATPEPDSTSEQSPGLRGSAGSNPILMAIVAPFVFAWLGVRAFRRTLRDLFAAAGRWIRAVASALGRAIAAILRPIASVIRRLIDAIDAVRAFIARGLRHVLGFVWQRWLGVVAAAARTLDAVGRAIARVAQALREALIAGLLWVGLRVWPAVRWFEVRVASVIESVRRAIAALVRPIHRLLLRSIDAIKAARAFIAHGLRRVQAFVWQRWLGVVAIVARALKSVRFAIAWTITQLAELIRQPFRFLAHVVRRAWSLAIPALRWCWSVVRRIIDRGVLAIRIATVTARWPFVAAARAIAFAWRESVSLIAPLFRWLVRSIGAAVRATLRPVTAGWRWLVAVALRPTRQALAAAWQALSAAFRSVRRALRIDLTWLTTRLRQTRAGLSVAARALRANISASTAHLRTAARQVVETQRAAWRELLARFGR
jgi:hypothetical protein